jgi:hypothetical protein
MEMIASRFTPLCSAGHLPLKGGDQPAVLPSLISHGAEKAMASKPLISPLEGEMSGRTEGGAKGHGLSFYCFKPLVEAA